MQLLRENERTTQARMSDYLVRLIHAFMLGYDVRFGTIYAIMATQSGESALDRRIGRSCYSFVYLLPSCTAKQERLLRLPCSHAISTEKSRPRHYAGQHASKGITDITNRGTRI